MNINPIVLSIPIYFLLIGIELLVERISSKKIYRLNDAITNISCGITQQISGIFFKVLGVGAYVLLFETLRIWTIPSNWYTLIILFIAADFCYYWAHRMSHEVNLFWGGHVVHHQSEDYNFSVALRQGSFQVVWTFMFYLPLAIIGFDPVDFVLMSALGTVYQFWIHTETIGKLGFLEYIFNTPSHHRVHHGRDPKYIDKNHAGVFIWWDMLFGTFQKEEERPTYGITKPINSWNPVWVNVHHYADMYQQMKHIKGFKNKLKFTFYKPGWLPEEMGGYQSAPVVDKANYSKFDTWSPKNLNLYTLFQYVIALAGTAFFLFNVENFNWAEKFALTSIIILTVVNCGALFELKTWVWNLETVRVIALPALLIMVTYQGSLAIFLVPAAILWLGVSIFWLQKIRKEVPKMIGDKTEKSKILA